MTKRILTGIQFAVIAFTIIYLLNLKASALAGRGTQWISSQQTHTLVTKESSSIVNDPILMSTKWTPISSKTGTIK